MALDMWVTKCMELYIKVNGNTTTDAKSKTFGCGVAIATSLMVTEMVKGKSINEASGRLLPIKMRC